MLEIPKPPCEIQMPFNVVQITQIENSPVMECIFTFLGDETILGKGNYGFPKDIFYLGFFNIYKE